MTKEQLEAMAWMFLIGTEQTEAIISGVSADFICGRYLLGMALQAAADATPEPLSPPTPPTEAPK